MQIFPRQLAVDLMDLGREAVEAAGLAVLDRARPALVLADQREPGPTARRDLRSTPGRRG